jgi:hypothetical protein
MTALLSATGFIAAWAVVAVSGSRTLGGLVLLAFAIACIRIWLRRDGARTAALLGGLGLAAFVVSHILGLVIGAWPAVLVVSAALAAACWQVSDSRHRVSTA